MSHLPAHGITLYSTGSCMYCMMAKRLLAAKGVTPAEIDVGSDRAQLGEMMSRSGRRTVPQIFIGERHIGGYDDLLALDRQGQLDALLARSGA
ncbi:glutaredoxin 3 [Rugamonas sp.]|uniref:glutaredoxin 3 n=1 Tax=Rugamonas sp. TaxID=1926287 RepID=UPI0025E16435|nr:glutaredoxin 3 [Rugamonas sp.]